MEDQIKALEKKKEQQAVDNNRKFGDLINMLKEMKDSNGSSSKVNSSEAKDSSIGNIHKTLNFNPKVEFPKFDGNNPRVWIKKCCKYFSMYKIPEEQKVDLASLNMVDKAEVWVSSYLSVRKHAEWSDFVIDLTARFRDEFGGNVVEQFTKLQQNDPLENYIDEFENVRAILMQNNAMLPDSYILDSFVAGLKPAVKPFVRAFKCGCGICKVTRRSPWL